MQKMIDIIAGILDRGVIQVTSTANVFSLWLSFEAVMGIVLLVSAILFLGGKEDHGFNFSHQTLAWYISLANIFVIYFIQFMILPFMLFQFFIFWVLKQYREREFIKDGILSS
jgi:hypothetical protein